ncbi:hypothetical protein DL96DRAFT_1822129 [Flagelloscypha sp. PMI_526]|nr:hypothetical protein DL96DRAFT_1822129 [Flagelloscypha sp. PMI_526]
MTAPDPIAPLLPSAATIQRVIPMLVAPLALPDKTGEDLVYYHLSQLCVLNKWLGLLRIEVQSYIQADRSFIVSYYILDDILQEIFGLAIEQQSLPDNPILFRLSAVSRAWRHVALNTPYLWSELKFHLSRKPTDNDICVAQRFINRAGTHHRKVSITLDLHKGGDFSTATVSTVEKLFQTIFSVGTIQTITDLHLSLPHKAFGLKLLSALPRSDWSSLDFIHIRALPLDGNYGNPPIQMLHLPGAAHYPSPRRLSFRDVAADLLVTNLFQWSQIEELRCDYTSKVVPPFNSLLALLPRLQIFELVTSYGLNSPEGNDQTAHYLALLKKLAITTPCLNYLVAINAPSLEKLVVHTQMTNPTNELRQFLERSPEITSIHLPSQLFLALNDWEGDAVVDLGLTTDQERDAELGLNQYLARSRLEAIFPSLERLRVVGAPANGNIGYHLVDISCGVCTLGEEGWLKQIVCELVVDDRVVMDGIEELVERGKRFLEIVFKVVDSRQMSH